MTKWDSYFARRMDRMQASEIREILKLLNRPGIISFAGGIPDPKLFPTSEIALASQNILSDATQAAIALQYSVSEGYLPLRTWLAEYMGRVDLVCGPDNILITNGSQQGLDFIGKLFLSPGDTALVAWPTYLGAMQAFNAYEANFDHLPGPGSNRTPESYTSDGKPKPKFGYVMPEFQNPTGTSLTLEQRNDLLDVAEQMDLPLIEDSAYEKLRYEGKAISPLITLAAKRAGGIDKAKVIYLGTFSKSIVPSLRIGWIVAPEPVIKKLVFIKQASDLHTSSFMQMIMHDVASKIIDSHTVKIREVYKIRRDAMLASLQKNMPKGIIWTKPEGGMFIWMTLPKHLDGAELLVQALEKENIAFVPGSAFFADRSGRNTIRLNFSLSDTHMIEEGIFRLGRLLRTFGLSG